MATDLRRTWGPFFSRFGRLLPVQAAAIPRLLAGESAILASPTASGKTEAALAPLIERHVPAGTEALRVLYIVPTRALVNDLRRRLDDPLRALRLPLAAKTGDLPALDPKEPAPVLLTTPESLDSLLCRQPGRFDELRAVVLDELHLVDGSYRGDQLRVLLRRLPRAVQGVILSATVSDPAALAARYLPGEVAVIDAGEPRELDLHLVSSPEEAVALLKERRRHKALWFCNRRRDVEELTQSLAAFWPKERIAAHHGSLSARERASVEAAMRDWEWGLCVATMTLEIGVDIGDVDAVVLQGPPPTPSAFRQRLGRACRREERIFAIGVCTGEGDGDTFELLRTSEVEDTAAEPDLSVAAQQTLSILFGSPGGVTSEALLELLAPLGPEPVLRRVVDHLEREGFVVRRPGGRLQASTRLMDLGEKGHVHSNVPTPREHRFVDAATGRPLGSALAGALVGDTLVFAGKRRRIVSMKGLDVRTVPVESGGEAPVFGRRSAGGAFRWLLPEELRQR